MTHTLPQRQFQSDRHPKCSQLITELQCPNSELKILLGILAVRAFPKPRFSSLFTLFTGCKFLSSQPLERLHLNEFHDCNCASHAPPAWALCYHSTIQQFAWMHSGNSRGQHDLAARLSVYAQLCSWALTGRDSAYHSSSNPRTFYLIHSTDKP